jgi:tripartite-type tricarboxylate transporter receptor subunit TctC
MSRISLRPALPRRRALRLAGAAALAASSALCATGLWAQSWPSRPLTIVSPYPAGGITDNLCRIVGEELAKALGQPVVVENRLGAGGAIAMASVAKAAPDGHTLVMGGSAVSTIVPALNPAVAYHPLRDFEPIAYVAGLPIVLVAHPSVPAANVREFMAHAKANAGSLNCAHHGPGTGTHLACLQFARALGVSIPDVPYRGAPQVNQDLLANRVQFYFGTLPTQIQLVRSGQLRAYGMASPQRVPFAPDIPTLAEQGLPMNLDSWNALYAPAGTPKPVLARLSSEVQRILERPEIRQRIEATGSVLRPMSAEDLRRLTDTEFEQYRKLAAETGVKLQ